MFTVKVNYVRITNFFGMVTEVELRGDKMRFIDLFSGIGGFRYPLENLGWDCVFSADNNEHACEMYKENFNDDSYCDIEDLDPEKIPDFDVLCAGFPCQSFSVSGQQKGFLDQTRGTLFFDVLRIISKKQPKAFILENVKNLSTHDKGRTMDVIYRSLTDLGYTVNYKVLNARDFGVPQNRERIIIIGNREGFVFDFDKLELNPVTSMIPFLEENKKEFEYLDPSEYTLLEQDLIKRQPSGLMFSGYRNKRIRTKGVREGTTHLSRVHKQPNRIYDSKGIHPTISSQESSGRYFIRLQNDRVRKLTIDEVYKFMGFPTTFKKVGSTGNLYNRIGNSVCVPMVSEIGKLLNKYLLGEIKEDFTMSIFEDIYEEATSDDFEETLSGKKQEWADTLIARETTSKGVYTVLLSSLFYKIIHPEQDVRYHQISLDNGYSGRTFDTNNVTPFLKEKRFLGAMKESGWLTRSLEQNFPYTLDYNGRISGVGVKEAFLNILNDVEENKADPKKYLLYIINKSVKNKILREVIPVNPVERESNTAIKDVVNLLMNHFNYSYRSRGASILPVVAIYSVYEVLISELVRFEGCYLDDLGSHYSSDHSSQSQGDIVIRNNKGELYEIVEIKFDIEITPGIVDDVYNKIKPYPIQRYYILSTAGILDEDAVYQKVNTIETEHGCQVIPNGIEQTLKYYLRLIKNPDEFLESYVKNLANNSEINQEKILAWNFLND